MIAGGVHDYGNEHLFRPSSRTDNVVVVNEDQGFTANLTTGTNDVLETSLPFPEEWDQDTEVVMVEQFNFNVVSVAHHSDDVGNNLGLSLSYLDRSPAATYRGAAADAEDEYHKAIFAPRMLSGALYFAPSGVASVEGRPWPSMKLRQGRYTPPFHLMMGHQPIYQEIYNNNFTTTLATGNETAASFSIPDAWTLDYWYHIAPMPKPLRDLMATLNGLPFRLAIPGS